MLARLLCLALSLTTPQDQSPRVGLGPIAGYSSGSGLIGGAIVSLQWPRWLLSGELSASTKGAITFRPQLAYSAGGWGIVGELVYEKQLENDYYGLGNGGDPDTSATYDMEQQEAEVLLSLSPAAGIQLGLGLAARHSVIFNRQESALWQQSPSELTGSQLTAGPRLTADWSGQLGLPVRVTAGFLHQEGGDASYSRARGQLAAYLPLGPKTVIAARGRLTRHYGTSTTPFPYQLYLGSLQGLRGYRDNRFSGDLSLLCSAELRQEVLRLSAPGEMPVAVGAVLFGDAGQVSSALKGLAMDRFHASGGLGLRLLLPGNMVLAADAALSSEGFGLSTGYGQTF